MRRVRRSSILFLALGLTFAGTSSADAATQPGWSLAKATAYIESYVRVPAPAIIAAATVHLQAMKQGGSRSAIAKAQKQLTLAKAGLGVDLARCLGSKAAPGGYVSFKCRLALSDDLGFSGKALGTWSRLATGSWAWRWTSLTAGGVCPPGWDRRTTNGFCT
jgi:hypothetical protein